MPAEFTSTMNFMAQPLAGAAAMSALGVGFASHAFGVWFGTMTAATTASQRMFLPMFEGFGMDVADFRDPPKKLSITAKSGPQTVAGADKPKVGRLGKGAKAASDDEAAETAKLALPEELVTEKPQPELKADAPTGVHSQELAPAAELASADAPEASEAVVGACCRSRSPATAADAAVEDVVAAPAEEMQATALEEMPATAVEEPSSPPRLRRWSPLKRLRNRSSKNAAPEPVVPRTCWRRQSRKRQQRP